jgi:hypothetical protein
LLAPASECDGWSEGAKIGFVDELCRPVKECCRDDEKVLENGRLSDRGESGESLSSRIAAMLAEKFENGLQY